MRRAALHAVRAIAATIFIASSGCSQDPLRIQVVADDDILRDAAAYVLTVFPGLECTSLVLNGGRYDLARTSTPALRRRVTSKDDLGVIDQLELGFAAVDVRAVDADDTPLARRCYEPAPTSTEVQFVLARFLPAGSTFTVEDPVAFRAGPGSKTMSVLVKRADGTPIPGAFVSIGSRYALGETAADGRVLIGTPTTAPMLDELVNIEVYGVKDSAVQGRVVVAPQPACPEETWSISLPERPAGAAGQAHVAVSGSVVFAIRADERVPLKAAIDVYRSLRGRRQMERVATSTVPRFGVIAAARDPRDGLHTIAIGGEDGIVRVLRYDATLRELTTTTSIAAGALIPPGRARFESIAIGSVSSGDTLDLFASAPEIVPAVVRFESPSPGRFGPALPALPLDDHGARAIALHDLSGDSRPEVVATAPDATYVFSWEGTGLAEPAPERVLRNVSGRPAFGPLNPLANAGDDLVLADETSGSGTADDTITFVDAGGGALQSLGSVPSGRGAAAAFVGDLNGDGKADVLALNRDGDTYAIFAGDARGHFVRANTCMARGGPSEAVAIDLDGDDVNEAVVVLEDGKELAVLGSAPP